jgi:hypothetical protein
MMWFGIALIVWILIRAGEKQQQREMIDQELKRRHQIAEWEANQKATKGESLTVQGKRVK